MSNESQSVAVPRSAGGIEGMGEQECTVRHIADQLWIDAQECLQADGNDGLRITDAERHLAEGIIRLHHALYAPAQTCCAPTAPAYLCDDCPAQASATEVANDE